MTSDDLPTGGLSTTSSRTWPPGSATGVGSMPGEDVAEATRVVVGALPDLPHLPELPGRGAPASMTGRALALLVGLGADLQPAGWRLTDAPGRDLRRARSLLDQDLDVLEERLQGYSGPLKVQVTGPWTLAATVERPRGDRVLADHGARRELAESLAEGLGGHVADVARRVPGAAVLVQLDEPALPAVMDGRVPTASGFSRHRAVEEPVVVTTLRVLVDAVEAAGAVPVVHCCAEAPPVGAIVSAGVQALSFDLATVDAAAIETYAAAYDAGVDLWPGVVPTVAPEEPVSSARLVRRLHRLGAAVGADDEEWAARCVVTPACGLAGASPAWAGEALRLVRTLGRELAGAAEASDLQGRMGP